MIDQEAWKQIHNKLTEQGVTLVAVSKVKPASDIKELYDLGQRDFGENYVQELLQKQPELPQDIRWHFIGHLQSNKVKYIVPFVHLIQTVESYELLQEIDKRAAKIGRTIDVLLQIYIAKEETKFGMDEAEATELVHQYIENKLAYVRICGLMGMATNTDDPAIIGGEYDHLQEIFHRLRSLYFSEAPHFAIRSMGMSGDYDTAIAHGSNMVRIGSLIFGKRVYS
jgi:PLP dependent protein